MPQLSVGYLDEIQAACPDPGHGRAYGALVMEASARRTVADLAEDVASEAGALEYDAGRLIRAVGAVGHEMDNDALHLARVATAMRVHAARFNPDTSSGIAGPAEAGERPVLSVPVIPAVAAAWEEAQRTAIAESQQAEAEERVLAALIQGHRETRQVMSMLPGSAFAGLLRREVFHAVRSLFASGRPQALVRCQSGVIPAPPTPARTFSSRHLGLPGLTTGTSSRCEAGVNTPPDARQGNDTLSPPDPAAALVISHIEMNTACGSGQALPLGRSIPWIARYGGSWWVECERGWLRVTDDLTAADLDQTAARLQAAEAMAATLESVKRLE